MTKVLVTGGAGFVGSHTVKELMDAGADVAVLDSFHQYIYPMADSYLENVRHRFNTMLKGAEIVRGSTLNKDDLRRHIMEVQPEVVVHFAALPLANVAIRQSEEAFDSILGGTTNLMEIIRDVGFVRRLVYISSSMVYGDFDQDPMPEDGRTEPKEIYGGMKLAGETLVKVYSQRYDFEYSIVRPSAVYGPTDNNRRVLQIFVENAFKGLPLKMKNGDTTYLDFTFVRDTAQGVRKVALSPNSVGQTFNITRGERHTLAQAAEMIGRHFPDLEVTDEKGDTFHPDRGSLSVAKAEELVDYQPQFSLDRGIDEYVEFMRRVNISISGS